MTWETSAGEMVAFRVRVNFEDGYFWVGAQSEWAPTAQPADVAPWLSTEEQEAMREVIEAARSAAAAWREASGMLAQHGRELAAGTLARVHVVAYTEAAQRMAERARALDEALEGLDALRRSQQGDAG